MSVRARCFENRTCLVCIFRATRIDKHKFNVFSKYEKFEFEKFLEIRSSYIILSY